MTAQTNQDRVPKRSEVRVEDTWHLELIFATPDKWEEAFKALDGLVAPLLAMRGKLNSAQALADCFAAEDKLFERVEALYAYSHMREDEDTGNSEAQARQQRMMAKYSQIAGQLAWIEPEILATPEAELKAWRDSDTLKAFRFSMDKLIRRKPHTLSDKEETLLSKAGEILGNPHNTYGYLTNADMKFPDVKDEKGEPQTLTNGRFVKFLENKNREVRKNAFEALYGVYKGHKNTLAATLSGSVKRDNYLADVRGFDSALKASLHPDNIPQSVVDTLIASVEEALPIYHDYVELRKEVMGISDLDMYDQYVPIVPDFDLKVSWEEACEWVEEACKPLGDHYMSGVKEAFTKRWFDVYENEGKRSGAYSGGCYGYPPFMLMNYQGNLNWVFTLAHELGHSMHTWLANQNNPYRDAGYTIFVAEIASTTNEALLNHWLMKNKADDKRLRAYLLNHLCDSFKGTVYRQTMFATYEKMIHEMDQNGQPLTPDAMAKAYYDLNAKYYGPNVKAHEDIAYEWSRIPHFHYNFYVYKYATGFCAAQLFHRQILSGEAGRDQYLNMLKRGGSADPLDLVRDGGVDLTRKDVLTKAFADFKNAIGELRGLLV